MENQDTDNKFKVKSKVVYLFPLSLVLILFDRLKFMGINMSVYSVLQLLILYIIFIILVRERGFKFDVIKSPHVLFISCFLTICLLSGFFAPVDQSLFFKMFRQFVQLSVMAVMLGMFLVDYWDDDLWEILLRTLFIVSIIAAITAITDFYGLTNLYKFTRPEDLRVRVIQKIPGIFGEANYGAGKLGVMLPFCLYYCKTLMRKRKAAFIPSILGIIIIAFAIFLTASRMGMLELMLALLLFFIIEFARILKQRSKVAIAILLVFLILAIVMLFPLGSISNELANSPEFGYTFVRFNNVWSFMTTSQVEQEGSIPARFSYLQYGIEKLSERPVLGFGLGSMTGLIANEYGKTDVAHNTFLTVLVETGLAGAFFFLALYILLLINFIKGKRYLGEAFFPMLLGYINLTIMMFFLSNYTDKLLWGMFIPISMYLEYRRKTVARDEKMALRVVTRGI